MKIHTIPFHMGDWLGGTIGWDALECGAYFNLLIAHYQIGEMGIPNNEPELAKYAKCSLKVWRRISPKIMTKFTQNGSSSYHQTCVDVLRKVTQISSENSAKVLKRWNKNIPTVLPQLNHGNTIHKPESISQNPIAANAAKQQVKKNEVGVFSHEECNAAARGDPAWMPGATDGDILPGGWNDEAMKYTKNHEKIYASWRKFKDVSECPYKFTRWKGWVQNEN